MSNLLIALALFAATAMLYKLATHKKCEQLGIIISERLAIVLLMAFYISSFDQFQFSSGIVGLGLLGGAAVFVSRWALLHALMFGKVSTSWIIVSLAVAIPIIAAIFIWQEIPDLRRAIGIILVPLAIILTREEKGSSV